VTLRAAGVAALAPEVRLEDHYGQLLLHLLMSDLQRLSVSAFADGHRDVPERLLAFLDRSLREGDEDVVNAVAVSFRRELWRVSRRVRRAPGYLAVGTSPRTRPIALREASPARSSASRVVTWDAEMGVFGASAHRERRLQPHQASPSPMTPIPASATHIGIPRDPASARSLG
jgi:hypothetical protein